MSDILKGNFKTQKQVAVPDSPEQETNLQQKLRKAALNSIGGSMVYVERTELSWDGDDEAK